MYTNQTDSNASQEVAVNLNLCKLEVHMPILKDKEFWKLICQKLSPQDNNRAVLQGGPLRGVELVRGDADREHQQGGAAAPVRGGGGEADSGDGGEHPRQGAGHPLAGAQAGRGGAGAGRAQAFLMQGVQGGQHLQTVNQPGIAAAKQIFSSIFFVCLIIYYSCAYK